MQSCNQYSFLEVTSCRYSVCVMHPGRTFSRPKKEGIVLCCILWAEAALRVLLNRMAGTPIRHGRSLR
jgi:hypothetical protein